MTALVDALVGAGVIAGFFFMIVTRLMAKSPKMKQMVLDFFPMLGPKKLPDIIPTDTTQQIWQEKRTMI